MVKTLVFWPRNDFSSDDVFNPLIYCLLTLTEMFARLLQAK